MDLQAQKCQDNLGKVEVAAGVRADFHFDGEAGTYFPLEVLPTVAELAGAKRRRRLSEEHKAKLVEVGQAYRFKLKVHGSNGRKTGLV